LLVAWRWCRVDRIEAVPASRPASRIRLTALGLDLAAALLAVAVQLAAALRPVEDVATDLLMRARGKAGTNFVS
jgi:hypothetical protein